MLIPDAFSILSEANLKIASLGSEIVDQDGTPKQPKTIRQLIRVRQLYNLLLKFIFLNGGGTAISYTIGENDAALNRLLLQLKRAAKIASFPIIPTPIQTFVSTYQDAGTIIIDINHNISGVNNITMTGTLSVTNVTISGALTLSTPLGVTSGGTGLNTISPGDILYGSALNVISRRSIGSNNTFLQVQSGFPAWTTYFTYDQTNNRFTVGNNTNTGNHSIVSGISCVNNSSWNALFGESNILRSTSGNAAMFGWSNVAGDGSLGGYGTLTSGVDNLNHGLTSVISGVGGRINYVSTSQRGGFVHAFNVGSVNGLKPASVPYLTANSGAGNISRNTSAQVDGNGALAQDSFILGGIDGHIPATSPRSILLGGNALQARENEPDQVYVANLNILSTPANDDALTRVLVQDSTTGQIKYRASNTIGSEISGLTTGTIPMASSPTSIADSIIRQSSSEIIISGTLETEDGFRTDSSGPYYKIIKYSGTWNMDTFDDFLIDYTPLGITGKVIAIADVTIVAAGTRTNLNRVDKTTGAIAGGISDKQDLLGFLTLTRVIGGYFDAPGFNAANVIATIVYEA